MLRFGNVANDAYYTVERSGHKFAVETGIRDIIDHLEVTDQQHRRMYKIISPKIRDVRVSLKIYLGRQISRFEY